MSYSKSGDLISTYTFADGGCEAADLVKYSEKLGGYLVQCSGTTVVLVAEDFSGETVLFPDLDCAAGDYDEENEIMLCPSNNKPIEFYCLEPLADEEPETD